MCMFVVHVITDTDNTPGSATKYLITVIELKLIHVKIHVVQVFFDLKCYYHLIETGLAVFWLVENQWIRVLKLCYCNSYCEFHMDCFGFVHLSILTLRPIETLFGVKLPPYMVSYLLNNLHKTIGIYIYVHIYYMYRYQHSINSLEKNMHRKWQCPIYTI